MNTSTTESPVLHDYATLPPWFDEANEIFEYVLAILQFFGFFINLVHLSVLTREDLRMNSVYRLMIGICSCDLISHTLTFIGFSPFWIKEVRKESQKCFLTMSYKDAFLSLYPVVVLDITQRTSSWLALAMALYRTLSVMFPMSARMQKMSKPKWAVWTILVLLLVNTSWTLVVFGRHAIVERNIDTDCDGNEVHLNPVRYLILVQTNLEHLHSTITYIYGFIKALPSLIDPILTVLLIIELRKAAKRTINLIHISILTRPQMRSNAVYRLMIGICCCDLLTQINTFLIFSPFWIRNLSKPEDECYMTHTFFDALLYLHGTTVLDITQRGASWMALLMALFRMLSVKFPLNAKIQKISRPVFALWTILAVIIFTSLTTWMVQARRIIRDYDWDYE
ncbi:hypothetical protein L5515_007143 [Caenorhabditis briggsae]|uniref:G-protein coupled receptors family 1 profile domain-containing protein n=1 Tax=Caenorhabditis briggsae TaxID=6238 RepID=A0AAE9JKU3_CAEBR|nr:hypothetical protein L5515_007143 [Caenorhabditis briggsae]